MIDVITGDTKQHVEMEVIHRGVLPLGEVRYDELVGWFQDIWDKDLSPAEEKEFANLT